jgi:hypothetical protein
MPRIVSAEKHINGKIEIPYPWADIRIPADVYSLEP